MRYKVIQEANKLVLTWLEDGRSSGCHRVTVLPQLQGLLDDAFRNPKLEKESPKTAYRRMHFQLPSYSIYRSPECTPDAAIISDHQPSGGGRRAETSLLYCTANI